MTDEGGARRLCGLLAERRRAQVFAATVLGAATRQDVCTATGLGLPEIGRPLRSRYKAL